jgi:hypothetical protein
MKLFRRSIITLVCIVASFIAHAGEPPAAKGAAPIASELQPLQGTWEGFVVGQEKDGTITITISSNSLHFHRDTNFWFKTTFTQPAGKDPKQLHATIKGCAAGQESSVGQVVVALYKIEHGTLTLLPIGDGDAEAAKSFEAPEHKNQPRYELRKLPPQKKKLS